ncbi:hypothetical protein E2I00_018875 [Balaenoptera physalus]|uniref:U2A'/phosphoprotein 32 family A C-terminal domain-containing protein n=1 Tax=Balaenoptera physalus TaxID=9770 RepID=A0A6A1Q269_BALPH|nr:hypothetical protein E2I00_018875 [Balaenoptera physalus]
MPSHTLLGGSVLLANSQREWNEFQESTAPASEQLLGPDTWPRSPSSDHVAGGGEQRAALGKRGRPCDQPASCRHEQDLARVVNVTRTRNQVLLFPKDTTYKKPSGQHVPARQWLGQPALGLASAARSWEEHCKERTVGARLALPGACGRVAEAPELLGSCSDFRLGVQLISILGGDFSGDKIISLGLRIAPTEKARSPEHHGCGLCFLLAFLLADKAQYFRFVETKFLRERFNSSVTDRFHSLGTGYKIPVIENLGATLDQFDAIDFSDNEIRKLDGEGLDQALPCLTELILTNNSLVELGDLDPLASLKSLTYLSILRNPVTNKKHYRLYVIYKVPQVRVLDFQKVKLKERQEAEKMFKGKRGAQLAKDIARRSKTFNPGAGLPTDKKKGGPSPGDVEAIKCFLGDGGLDESNCPSPLSPGIQNAIANASTLAEVERLKGLLQSGQIPGRERRSGNSVLSFFPN